MGLKPPPAGEMAGMRARIDECDKEAARLKKEYLAGVSMLRPELPQAERDRINDELTRIATERLKIVREAEQLRRAFMGTAGL